jgi:predicted thioesterase
MTDPPAPGRSGWQVFDVTEADTAIAHGSGDVAVLATPRLVAMMEAVALSCVADDLDDDVASVGVRIDAEHLLPTPVGGAVVVSATIIDRSERTTTFAVEATDRDSGRLIGRGTHRRATVRRSTFPGGPGGPSAGDASER